MEIVTFKGSDNPPLLELIGRLRQSVWQSLVPEDVSINRFGVDSHDACAWHICLRECNGLVASSRLSFHKDGQSIPEADNLSPVMAEIEFPMALMTRLVVIDKCRDRGFAATLDRERLKLARQEGAASLWVEVIGRRVEALQSLGFRLIAPSGDLTIPGHWQILGMRKI